MASPEVQPTVKQFTAEQKRAQELLLRDHRVDAPGEGAKRFSVAAGMFGIGTVLDLGESHLIDWVMRKPLEKFEEHQKERAAKFTFGEYKKDLAKRGKDVPRGARVLEKGFKAEKEQVVLDVKRARGIKNGADFMEEWASDTVVTSLANAWVRLMTGDESARLVSETAAFLADWGNIITQVFFNDVLIGKTKVMKEKIVIRGKVNYEKTLVPARGPFGVKLAYKSMDMVNPLNIEGAIRMAEELPVVGKGVSWLHDRTDHMLETKQAQVANTVAGKGILGYHIGRNVMR